MASVLDVFNLALTRIDVSTTIQSVNDTLPEAGACKRFYDFARKRVLEKAYWDFATKAAALALVLDQSTLSVASKIAFPGWRYVYSRPVDAVRCLAVTTQFGLRVNPNTRWWYDISNVLQTGPYRPPWRQMIDTLNPAGAGNAIDILTDQDSAWLVYVQDVPNVNLWSAAFLDCVAWNLGALIAGPLSANQTSKASALKMAETSITSAVMLALNEQQPDPYPSSPAIVARN